MSSVLPWTVGENVEKYQFDGFELFPKQRALWRAGARIPLMPKPLDTLVVLVESAGLTVSKEDLLTEIWNGAAVEENNLTQSISTLRKTLGEKRGENRYIVTDPGRGYRFVAPVSRFLETAPVSLEPLPELVGEPRSRSAKAIALTYGIVLLLTVLGWWLWAYRASAQPPSRQAVAVLRIRDLSKTSTEAWLETALAEMLTSELAAAGKLRAVPTEDVVRWKADFGAGAGNAPQAPVLRSARQNLGADTFVTGSYVVIGTCPNCRMRVDLSLMKAQTGERFATIIDEGSAADLLDLTTRLGRRLRAGLGLNADAPTSPRWPAASAMREYAEGLDALRQMDPIAARDWLRSAAASDPGNALIHSALAEAWTALGYGTHANEENRRAYDLSGSLDRLDRLGIEARYRASVQQWDRAVEIYKAIFQLFPDSLDDGLNLARAQLRAMTIAEADSTLSALRKLPAPAGSDPRIDLNEAQAAGALNDYPRTRELAHRAAEEAKRRGARYLFARSRLLEGGAMQNMNDPNYYAVQTEAREVCQAIGDRDCLSKAWRIRGNERFFAGDLQSAEKAYLQGIGIARELGNQSELANLLVGFGVVAKANRDWGKAEQNLVEAISLRINAGYNPNEVRTELAELYVSMGRLADAEQILNVAHATARTAGAHEDLGEILRLEAMLARSKGELDRAQKFGESAAAELRRTGNPFTLSLALAGLSSVCTARGELAAAEKNLGEAVPGKAPEGQGAVALARAELWIATGRFTEAAHQAENAAADFDKAHRDDLSAQALVTAADALEMSNRVEDARAACREGEQRALRTPNPYPAALAQLCAWRLTAAPGNAFPEELQTKIARLDNPELTLRADYARATRVTRAGGGDRLVLFNTLAATAVKRDYVTISRQALLLAHSER